MVTVIHFRPEFARAVVIEDTQRTSRGEASHARKGCGHTLAHDLALTHAHVLALILDDAIGRENGNVCLILPRQPRSNTSESGHVMRTRLLPPLHTQGLRIVDIPRLDFPIPPRHLFSKSASADKGFIPVPHIVRVVGVMDIRVEVRHVHTLPPNHAIPVKSADAKKGGVEYFHGHTL